MNIQFVNNHIVLPVKTNIGIKNALLDTGNPGPTFFNDEEIVEFSVDDIKFNIKSDFATNWFRQLTDWGAISNLAQSDIQGVIGYDFFIENDIILNLKDNAIDFNCTPDGFDTIDISFFMNVPIVNITIQNLFLKAMFDTGAMYTVIESNHKGILNNLNKSIKDYNPTLSEFTAELFTGNIKIGNILISNSTIACSEEYDFAMSTLIGQEIKGILGIGNLYDKEILISYKDKKLGIKSR